MVTTDVMTAGPVPGSVPPRHKVLGNVLLVFGITVAVVLAIASSLSVGTGSKTAVVLPVAVGIGVVVGLIALTRFQVYVITMLVLRSTLDITKVSGHQAGKALGPSSRALDPSSILALIFLVVGILWLAAQYRREGRLPGSRLRLALSVYFCACLASVIAAHSNRLESVADCLRFLAVVVMFVVLEQMMRDRTKIKPILAACFCSLISPLLYTIIHPQSETKGGYTRLIGTFSDSNDFGRYLMLFVIFTVAMLPHLEKKWRRVLGVALVPMTGFMVLTLTRSALGGTVIGLVIIGIIQDKRVLAALGIAFVVALLAFPALGSRLNFSSSSTVSTNAVGQTTAAGGDASLTWRLGYWTQVLPLANSSPLIGIGLDQTQFQTNQAKQPHNDFIRSYVETGILGCLAYLAFIVALVSLGRRAVKATLKGTYERGVAVGYLGCAWAFVACSAIANVITTVVNLWYLFAFAAAASAIVQHAKRYPSGVLDDGEPLPEAGAPAPLPAGV